MSTPIAVIGLGSMGAALANRLLAYRKEVHVWNRTASRPAIQELVAKGARLRVSVAETIKACTTVIICVLDYSSIDSILVDIDAGKLNGKTIINLTNGTVSEAGDMSEKLLQGRDVAVYFDGAVMTTPKLVGTEASFLFCSGGTRSDFENQALALLQHFGRVDYLGPDPRAAAGHDLALLAAMCGMFDGTLTAIGLLTRVAPFSVSSSDISDSLASIVSTKLVPMLQALLPLLVRIAEQVEGRDDSAGDHPNDMMAQGLRNIVSTCDEMGVDAGAAKHLLSVFESVEAEGGGKGGMGLVGRKYL